MMMNKLFKDLLTKGFVIKNVHGADWVDSADLIQSRLGITWVDDTSLRNIDYLRFPCTIGTSHCYNGLRSIEDGEEVPGGTYFFESLADFVDYLTYFTVSVNVGDHNLWVKYADTLQEVLGLTNIDVLKTMSTCTTSPDLVKFRYTDVWYTFDSSSTGDLHFDDFNDFLEYLDIPVHHDSFIIKNVTFEQWTKYGELLQELTGLPVENEAMFKLIFSKGFSVDFFTTLDGTHIDFVYDAEGLMFDTVYESILDFPGIVPTYEDILGHGAVIEGTPEQWARYKPLVDTLPGWYLQHAPTYMRHGETRYNVTLPALARLVLPKVSFMINGVDPASWYKWAPDIQEALWLKWIDGDDLIQVEFETPYDGTIGYISKRSGMVYNFTYASVDVDLCFSSLTEFIKYIGLNPCDHCPENPLCHL